MKKLKILFILSIFGFISIQSSGQEVPCDLPPKWKCGYRLADAFVGWTPQLYPIIRTLCLKSVQTNACDTSKAWKDPNRV